MSGGNIKVVVRVRPFNSRETDRNAKCIVSMKETQTVLTPPPETGKGAKAGAADHGTKTFAFDKSYWSFDKNSPNYAGQDDLFQDLGGPLLDNAFKGYNNCIFAYGQTGSGKSYSMMGYGPEQGVIPKICQDMFRRIDEIQLDKNLGCTVEVSYLEIYNEKVRDLLNPANKGHLKVREHPSTGPYVEDLAKLAVRSFPEIENLMDEGNKARTVAATNMNETSSRSHAVFTLTLTQKRHDVETSMDTEKVAKISLVDLAGSERANSTGATGARLKEGAEINRSLSTLGRCIAALADLSSGKKKNANLVPYRDSVLTWLLKDSLGGNSMTAMIAAISPADINFEETLSTLRYADSAKRIKNHAVINEDPNARMIRELKEELAQLRAKLGGGGGGAIEGGIPQEQYAPGTPLDQQFVSITQADGSIKKVSKADIAEQLSQSEKLYKDLNQTWEEKLLRTEEIQKEREQALEDLGISIEKGFVGMSTPKKMPHLVNLSDDPLLAECLVYNLKPGKTTVGSSEDPDTVCEIRLNGSKILKEHCVFEHANNTVTVIPTEGAAVMVNGLRVDKPTKLSSGNRIILGDFHIFRYNNPQEARQERAERGTSLLRHSITPRDLQSPSPRPPHSRSVSQVGSDIDDDSRPESPTNGRDFDWAFARREAASAILGVDQKINHLTDEELDALFDDVQRARALRRGRPESRLMDDDESESVSSGVTREKYMSNGTMDNLSLDTALTMPGTPQINGDDGQKPTDDRLQQLRDSMQTQLDKQKEEYQEQLRATESTTDDMEKLRADKERMEEELRAAKEELQAQLKHQKREYEVELQEKLEAEHRRRRGSGGSSDNGLRLLTNQEKLRATHVVERWRQLRNLGMAETMLTKAILLKEAQVMSQLMDKGVMFQFIVVDEGQDASSSYDMVLNGIAEDESDDEGLYAAVKPCVAVRVIDYNHSVIHLWSLDKLERRVQAMKQMHQYHDRPDYMQHFHLENPFIEAFQPQYSMIGDAHVPLTAVFERRVQDYTVDVLSPYTHQCIGVIKLSLEPSSAEAPPSTLKFNVVMHDMTGFAEREGTEVHAQMFVPGLGADGASTTTMIAGFDEGAIRFESVHGMSIPADSPDKASLLVAVFARVAPMHLDKLLSWDEVRELAEQPARTRKRRPRRARLPETEFYTPEQHDVFAKVQILEMDEKGEYTPVEVEGGTASGAANAGPDTPTYQLHQGLQRRLALDLTHCSSEPLQWESVSGVRAGSVRLVDPLGKSPDLVSSSGPKSPDISLKFIGRPAVDTEAGGPTHLRAVAQWDSSLHGSVLLDRPTAERYAVQVSFVVTATCARTSAPLRFPLTLQLAVRPRAWIRPQSMFRSLWRAAAPARSTTALFAIQLAPAPSKRATDLWRLDTSHGYVKGEEELGMWQARGVSLVRDFVAAARKRQRVTEVEAAKASLARLAPPSPMSEELDDEDADEAEVSAPTNGAYTPTQVQLLQKTLALWKIAQPALPEPPAASLATPPLSPPASTAPNAKLPAPPPARLTPTVVPIPRNPVVLKAGMLMVPAPTGVGWLRRHGELRPPYLHLRAVDGNAGTGGAGSWSLAGGGDVGAGEEVAVLNLRNATVDSDPAVGRVLLEQSGGRAVGSNVWAVYAVGGSGVFACRSAQAKAEWIWAVDRAFLGPERDEWGSESEEEGA